MTDVTTLARDRVTESELEVRRSRFITRLARVPDEDAARELVAAARADFPDALAGMPGGADLTTRGSGASAAVAWSSRITVAVKAATTAIIRVREQSSTDWNRIARGFAGTAPIPFPNRRNPAPPPTRAPQTRLEHPYRQPLQIWATGINTAENGGHKVKTTT